MQTQLKISPYIPKKGNKTIRITLTNIQLHSSVKRQTPSVGKSIGKSIQNNEEGRIYFSSPKFEKTSEENKMKISIEDIISKDENLMKLVQNYQSQGIHVIIEIPKEIPIFLGKDTKEFFDSKNGKRIFRKMK